MSLKRLAALLAALALAPGAAHAQSTITACYVPKSGSVYRIEAPGTPEMCKAGHTEFSWPASAGSATAPVYFPNTLTEAFFVAPGVTQDLTMSCPASEALILGGYVEYGPNTLDTEILANMPNGTGNEWLVRVANHGADLSQVVLYIRCFTLVAAP